MSRFFLNDPLKRTGLWLRTETPRRASWRPMSLTGTSSMIISPSASDMCIRATKKDNFFWRPKCNNCPKCNEVLNVIIPMQSLTPSVHCCYGGHPHRDVEVTAVAPKKNPDQYTCHVTGSLISISVFFLARHKSRSTGRMMRKWHQMTAGKTISTLTKTSPYVTGSDS